MNTAYKQVWLMLVILLLVGCASNVQPQTVREGIVVVSEHTAAYMETANRLYDQGSITADQHKDVLGHALDVRSTLNDVRSLLEAGKDAAAQDQLQLARKGLVGLRDRLKELQNE